MIICNMNIAVKKGDHSNEQEKSLVKLLRLVERVFRSWPVGLDNWVDFHFAQDMALAVCAMAFFRLSVGGWRNVGLARIPWN